MNERPHGCFICGAVPSQSYSLARARQRRDIRLCAEHAAPIEEIMKLTRARTRRDPASFLADD